MKQQPIIFRLLTRYLKEKGIFYDYKHFFTLESLNNAISEIKTNRTSSLLYPFRLKDDNAISINIFLDNLSNENEFNRIMHYYLKGYIKKFLKYNNVYDDFINNRRNYIAKTNQNAIHYNDEEIFNGYVKRLADNNYSIRDFLFSAFCWQSTGKSSLWSDLHEKYLQFILDLLTK